MFLVDGILQLGQLSLNLIADYTWPVGDGDIWVRGEYVYKDTQFSTIEDVTYLQTSNQLVLADTTQPAVGANILGQIPDRSDGFPFKTPEAHIINLRGGWNINENWEFNLFVHNATDEKYFTGAGDKAPAAGRC